MTFLPAYSVVQAYTLNASFGATRVGEETVRSKLGADRLFWLYLSNTVAVVASLGLLIPWATVRLVRYRLENVSLVVRGSLDGFLASERSQVAATGQEVGEMFDLDFGL